MKVWIAFEYEDEIGSTVLGVFRDEQKAHDMAKYHSMDKNGKPAQFHPDENLFTDGGGLEWYYTDFEVE